MEKLRVEKASTAYQVAYLAVKTAMVLSNQKMTASGLENLPAKGPYLLAYTHHNSWDTPILGSIVYEHTKMPVYFMAKEELLGRLAIGSLLRSMHALPVSRNGIKDIGQIRQPIEVLRQGGILSLAPEGGRVNGDEVAETQGGVGFIATRADVEVIPVGITGINRQPFLPRHIHVHFGESIVRPNGASRAVRQEIDRELAPALQDSLDEAYIQYGLIHGEKAASRLDIGLTKLF